MHSNLNTWFVKAGDGVRDNRVFNSRKCYGEEYKRRDWDGARANELAQYMKISTLLIISFRRSIKYFVNFLPL